VYAPDIWPIIGLKSAVIVVGGSEMGEEGEEEEEENGGNGDGDGDDGSDGDGASGNVVNRMPVDTARRLVGLATFCYISCTGERAR